MNAITNATNYTDENPDQIILVAVIIEKAVSCLLDVARPCGCREQSVLPVLIPGPDFYQ